MEIGEVYVVARQEFCDTKKGISGLENPMRIKTVKEVRV